jgi:hypothetical protein
VCLDFRVRANAPVLSHRLNRERRDRLRPAEWFFGAARRPARPAWCSQSDRTVAAGSSCVPSGSRGEAKAIVTTLTGART